ncbi:MAG: ATP-binding SpoIIE family protein phosphatase, partial [Vulcanimicrobiaceae bacterium]
SSPWAAPPLALVGASAVVLVVSRAPSLLPPLVVRGHVTAALLAVCAAAGALAGLALLQAGRNWRERSAVRQWTIVAAVALGLDALVSAFCDQRFALGWYLARSLEVVSATAVFAIAAVEIVRLSLALRTRLQAESEFRALAGAIPQIVWIAGADGTIEWFNSRWYEYTGRRHDEGTVWAWQRVHHPDDLAELSRRWIRAIASARELEVEVRLRGLDDAYRWFLTRVVPVRAANGRVVKWYGTCTDIDESRRTADRLRDLYAREHRIAETLQHALLPTSLPRFDGLAFSHVYLPAAVETQVGGDWYDAFALPDGRVAVCIGDVSGHGLGAAAGMIRAREVLRAAAAIESSPGRVLERTAIALEAYDPDELLTVAFGIFDLPGRRFTYATAGHPPPARVRNGRAEMLQYGGQPLGIDPSPYDDREVALEPGDVFALFTDGLLEATRNPIEGEVKLTAALATGLIDAPSLAEVVLDGGRRDDVAVLAIAIGTSERERGCEPIRPWRYRNRDAAAASGGRPSFAQYLRAFGVGEDQLLLCELAFGELVANVVRHAAGPLEIEVSWQDGSALLCVMDRGPGIRAPIPGALPAPLAQSGRGFVLLETLGMPATIARRSGGGASVSVALPIALAQAPVRVVA